MKSKDAIKNKERFRDVLSMHPSFCKVDLLVVIKKLRTAFR